MSDEIKVSREGLSALYTTLKSATSQLELILAEIGCIHNNKVNISTMGAGDTVQTYFCSECDTTIEEVQNDELD